MFKNFLAATGLLAVPLIANAAVLPPSSLCDSGNGCLLANAEYSTSQVSIYRGIDTNTGLQTIWAGYNLGTQSQYYQPADYDPYFGPAYTTPLSGTLWIKAQAAYGGQGSSSLASYSVEVYSPDTSGSFREQSFLLNGDALLSGHGYAINSGGAGEIPWDQITVEGNMGPDNYATCIECGWDIELNLVNLSYVDDGSGNYIALVKPGDTRSLVYRDETDYYYGHEYRYSISNVPLPGSAGFFVTALLGLGVLGRRRT